MTTTVLTVGPSGDFSTIQAAINAAHDGDTIVIAAGTFKEQLTIDGKHVTLSGAGQDQTIILSPDAANLTVNLVDSSRACPTNTRSSASRTAPTSPSTG